MSTYTTSTLPNLFAQEPEIDRAGVSLRDYQLEAIEAIERQFAAGKKSTLLVLPTGTGKTVTFGFLARQRYRDFGQRTLVLAHRGELIEQASDTLATLGLTTGIEQAGSRARAGCEPHAVIATVQTMQGARLAGWPKDYFGLLVTDEAHHATADSYGRVYDHFRSADHLGVTATADRGDKTNLGLVYESVAYEYTLLDAMTAEAPGPYLSRLTVAQCELGIDLREIRTVGGDLNQADLEEVIRPYIEPIANAIVKEVGDRPTLVFTPDVGSAMALGSALASLGLRADYVSGDDTERREKVARYRAGDVQVLCNCALLTEGFDAPRTAAIVLCRPTKSRSLYAQMVGRGTRIAEGKSDCLIVDFDWICGRHRLIKPVELLAAKLTESDEQEDEIRARAGQLMASGQEPDLLDAIEKATIESEEKQARRRLELSVRRTGERYRRVQYDPLAAYHALGFPSGKSLRVTANTALATPKQAEYLERLGFAGAESMSKRRAGKILDVHTQRRDKGLCTYKQASYLIAYGVDPKVANTMSLREASERLGEIWGGKGK